MLVLTRKPGESIVIGQGIVVTVVKVGPGRVKLGIEAPQDVRVDRDEVHAKLQQKTEGEDAQTEVSIPQPKPAPRQKPRATRLPHKPR
jgi:carbon storage regulator